MRIYPHINTGESPGLEGLLHINMTKDTVDFLIIGGGVIGLNIALQVKRRFADCSIALIEKESYCGAHASGRNSGVLHAGFYYTADSLKARFTRDGNKLMREYCAEKGIPLNQCGKLVVARDETDLAGLDELLRRGKHNGVELSDITEQDAREIEPRVKTHQRALFSPTTASVNPVDVMKALATDAQDQGINIRTNTAYLRRSNGGVTTNQGDIQAGYIVNAAGLYADKIAKDFGFSQDYAIIPFKGLYLYSNEAPGSLRTNIYPVPNLNNPFLGVHYTLTADGKVKIGPTAIPAFWREHYHGFNNFKPSECLEILHREASLWWHNDFGFRRLASEELKKYHRPRMVNIAATLLTGVKPEHYTHWGKPGIRAQLINTKHRKLEMDFRYEGDNKSFHVLNAVSPAFTCSMALGEFLVNQTFFG